jgi:hypothetical protein
MVSMIRPLSPVTNNDAQVWSDFRAQLQVVKLTVDLAIQLTDQARVAFHYELPPPPFCGSSVIITDLAGCAANRLA